MKKLVLLRHGESLWNQENRFTGWTDVDLSPKGIKEAFAAGVLLKKNGFVFDVAFTSVLRRAIRTLWITLDEMDLMWIPIHHSWRLNERHYGALQGLNKAETAKKYGEKQVLIWRRSYTVSPPALDKNDPRNPRHDPRYRELADQEIPLSECLQDTVARFLPYWNNTIVPVLQTNQRIIITAHGNSLRALIKHLEQLSDEEIIELNIPTAVPLVYEFDSTLKPLRRYYLGNQEEVALAMRTVAEQGKASNAIKQQL